MATDPSHRRVNWPELVGLVGLIASLVFVGYEVQQNTQVARAEAYRAFVTEVNTWYLNWSSPEMATVAIKAYSDLSSLSPVERAQLFSMQMAIFRIYEGLHKEVTEGVLDESALLLLSQSDWSQDWTRTMWPEISRNLTPDFVAYVEEVHPLSR